MSIFRRHTKRRAAIIFLLVILSGSLVAAASVLPDIRSTAIYAQVWPTVYPYSAAFRARAKAGYVEVENMKTGLWYLQDYHSVDYNQTNGLRDTYNQPTSAPHTLYVYGDSTVEGFALPDADTLPSKLQALTRAYRVVNMGLSGTDTNVSLLKLKQTTPNPGDLIVFYSGISDEHEPKFCANAAKARQYSEAHGATFVIALEPYLYSTSLSEWEQALADRAKDKSDYYSSYSDYRQCADVDLSHALDAVRHSGVDVYFDEWHLSAQGNTLIARALWNKIAPEF